jgi:hypothetical protein
MRTGAGADRTEWAIPSVSALLANPLFDLPTILQVQKSCGKGRVTDQPNLQIILRLTVH